MDEAKQTVIQEINFAKDMIQSKPEQDTFDYTIWKALHDAQDYIEYQERVISKLAKDLKDSDVYLEIHGINLDKYKG